MPEIYMAKIVTDKADFSVGIGLDETAPEIYAAMAAMYSRTTKSVKELATMLSSDKASGFLDKYYIGYGHASIGDLVDVKVFIENVPMYIATMIQHHPLYRGQESSTRYIDFTKQGCANTANKDVFSYQLDAYLTVAHRVTEKLTKVYVDNGGTVSDTILRAISARSFDISRGLIPICTNTNVAWFGSLRSIVEHLQRLYALKPEFKDYWLNIYKTIKTVHPNIQDIEVDISNIDTDYGYPGKYALVKKILRGKLDYGSYRDLHRHRLGRQILNIPKYGGLLHSWYIDMYRDFDCVPIGLIKSDTNYEQAICTTNNDYDHALLASSVDIQYTPSSAYSMNYFLKLRSKPTVHPTLRFFLIENGYTVSADCGTYGFFEHRGKETFLYKDGTPVFTD